MRTTENELHAAFALAKKGDFTGIGVLVAGLGSDRNEVRLRAASYCALVGPPAAIAPLIRMIKEDPDSDNRGEAMYALAGIGRPEVVPPLIAALGDADPSRRSDAGTALYEVLGDRIVRLLSDEEASGEYDADERRRISSWWTEHSSSFDPDLVYLWGELAGPDVLVHKLKDTWRHAHPIPDAILGALTNWTGEDFGQKPRARVIAGWEKWLGKNGAQYEPGRRYFYAHRVPG